MLGESGADQSLKQFLSLPHPLRSLCSHSPWICHEISGLNIRGDMTDKGNITDLGICPGGAPGEPITILLIDDLDSIVDVMAEVLEAGGYRVISALCGQDGLSMFRETPVDVILCDLCMPQMDGWEVAKAIRNASEEKGVPKPPFLLVTAWADQICGDKRLLESGVDAVLGKPVTFLELSQAIEMALQKPGQ